MATEIRDASGALIGHQLEHTAQQLDDAVESVDDLTQRVTELENSGAGSGSGLTDDAKQALLACFQNVAWINDSGQNYYDALEDALYPPANLLSIGAAFDANGQTIYTTTPLNDLKQYLVVTAAYDDGSTQAVTNYALSGTLKEGVNTMTVVWGGKSATFEVTAAVYVEYIRSWDFTKSLVDSVESAEAVLGNGLSRDENGLQFTAATQYCSLGFIFQLGRTYEIEFGPAVFLQTDYGRHLRVLMYGGSASSESPGTSTGILVHRGKTGWSAYTGSWSDVYGELTDRDAISQTTIRLVVDYEGYITVYQDGVYVGKSTVAVSVETGNMYIGNSASSSGGDLHNLTVRAFRVIKGAE